MRIQFACPICGTKFQVDDSFTGKKGRCQKCGAIVDVPTPIQSNIKQDPSPSQPALKVSDKVWFFLFKDRQFGPLTESELHASFLTFEKTELIRKEGMEVWVPYSSIFKPKASPIAEPPPAIIARPPIPSHLVPSDFKNEYKHSGGTKSISDQLPQQFNPPRKTQGKREPAQKTEIKNKKIYILLLFAIFIFIVGYIYSFNKSCELQTLIHKDNLHWEAVEKEQTIDSIQEYVKSFPNGIHLRDVDYLMNEIIRIDDDEWINTSQTNTITSFDEYIAKYPHGRHVIEAKLYKEKIIINNQQAWTAAKSINTVAAYQEYLNKFKRGLYAKQAKENIDTIEWEKAKESLTLETLQFFIKNHPDSPCAKEAANILNSDKYQDIAAWKTAHSKDTVDEYEKYLKLFPNGEHTNEARNIVSNAKWKFIIDNPTFMKCQTFLTEFPESSHCSEAKKYIDELRKPIIETIEKNYATYLKRAGEEDSLSSLKDFSDNFHNWLAMLKGTSSEEKVLNIVRKIDDQYRNQINIKETALKAAKVLPKVLDDYYMHKYKEIEILNKPVADAIDKGIERNSFEGVYVPNDYKNNVGTEVKYLNQSGFWHNAKFQGYRLVENMSGIMEIEYTFTSKLFCIRLEIWETFTQKTVVRYQVAGDAWQEKERNITQSDLFNYRYVVSPVNVDDILEKQ